jgi:hypothetical protein
MKRPQNAMTIISASYKTDIPAFFGDWFRARRMAGSWEVRNAWNGILAKRRSRRARRACVRAAGAEMISP